MTGNSLVTTINTQTGHTSYMLERADGTSLQGNVAANGNVSFHTDGKAHVFAGGTYLGAMGMGSPAPGVLADGTTGDYSYHPGSGEISRRLHTIGGAHIAGFTLLQTSVNGSVWGNDRFQFDNTAAATAADDPQEVHCRQRQPLESQDAAEPCVLRDERRRSSGRRSAAGRSKSSSGATRIVVRPGRARSRSPGWP